MWQLAFYIQPLIITLTPRKVVRSWVSFLQITLLVLWQLLPAKGLALGLAPVAWVRTMSSN